MAIYDIKPGEGVLPTLGTMTGYQVPLNTTAFGGIDRAINASKEQQDKLVGVTQNNMKVLDSVTDKMTGLRVDNKNQQSVFDLVKTDTGIENIFSTVTMESLQSPYGTKIVENAYNKFTADPRLESVLMEQAYADAYKKDVSKIDDEALRGMAQADYEDYRAGNVTGDKLNASVYAPIDIPTAVAKEFKRVAPIIERTFSTNEALRMRTIDSKKYKEKETLNLALNNMMESPVFINNLVARKYYDKKTKALTPEGRAYFDAMIELESQPTHDYKDKIDPYKKEFSPGRARSGGGSGGGYRHSNNEASRRVESARANMAAKYGINTSHFAGDYAANKDASNKVVNAENLNNYVVDLAFKGNSTQQSAWRMLAAGTGKKREQLAELFNRNPPLTESEWEVLMTKDFKEVYNRQPEDVRKDFGNRVRRELKNVKAAAKAKAGKAKPSISKESAEEMN